MAHCSACGATIPNEARNCVGCGRPVTALALPDPVIRPRRRRIWPWVLLAILLAAAMVRILELSGDPKASGTVQQKPLNLTLEQVRAACGEPDSTEEQMVDGRRNQVLSYSRYATEVHFNRTTGVFFESARYQRLWSPAEVYEHMPCLAK